MHAEDLDPVDLFFNPPANLFNLGCTRVTFSRVVNLKIEGADRPGRPGEKGAKPQLFVADAAGVFYHVGESFKIDSPGFTMDTVAKVLSLRWPHIDFYQRLPDGSIMPVIVYGAQLPPAPPGAVDIDPADPFGQFRPTGAAAEVAGKPVDVRHYTDDDGGPAMVEVIIPPDTKSVGNDE